jgi:hypothetical protein
MRRCGTLPRWPAATGSFTGSTRATVFEEFLSGLRAKKRKNIRRDRRRVEEAGIHFVHRTGAELGGAEMDFIHECYQATFLAHGNHPALTRDFFDRLAAGFPQGLLAVIALRGQQPLAMSLFLAGGGRLYGRYWGCLETVPGLHFETTYHQGIEYCIEQGLQVFEPGAQGEHKISRGFIPVHAFLSSRARRCICTAIADFLRQGAGLAGAVPRGPRGAPTVPTADDMNRLQLTRLGADPDALFPPTREALPRPNGLLAGVAALNRSGCWPPTGSASFLYSQGEPILWWSPAPRCVIFPAAVHLSQRTRRRYNTGVYRLSADTAFSGVISACAEPRKGDPGTWITPAGRLRLCTRQGATVEVWRGRAGGGVYGLALGRGFWRVHVQPGQRCQQDRPSFESWHLVPEIRPAGLPGANPHLKPGW